MSEMRTPMDNTQAEPARTMPEMQAAEMGHARMEPRLSAIGRHYARQINRDGRRAGRLRTVLYTASAVIASQWLLIGYLLAKA